ncbi:DNA replication licensing factor mcm2 [Drechslerella stenobrocha 248]|uniref:DNA replication licensing factor MCM2 n=1 Tax=Drechslerella stenobrocha 248 TaxID=1043628 RepID=W7I2L1_9PEZI|nr:DNA replication licensing factor mcm2 [Drechslerella stenobrocha 248]
MASSRKRIREEEYDDDINIASTASPALSQFPPSSPPRNDDTDDEEDLVQEDDGVQDLDDLEEQVEDEDGIDLMAYAEDDYRSDALKDQYEEEGLDEAEYGDDIDLAQRRALERRMNARDEAALRARGKPAAFLDDDDDNMSLLGQPMRRRHRYTNYDEVPDEEETWDQELSLEALADVKNSSLPEWIALPAVQRSIAREFKNFLLEYVDPSTNQSVYSNRIRNLGEMNDESLEISYPHLADTKAVLAYFLANAPTEILPIFDTVAMDAVLLHYQDYDRIHPEIHVRVSDVPAVFTLRDLRQSHLNALVRVSGVVTRRTGVFPQLKIVRFDCKNCGITLGPFQQEANVEVKISFCQNCQTRGPFTLNSEKTVYRNYQKLTLQESPGTVPAGRLPRHREVILLWDLIDTAKPGEEVEVTGIYRNNYDAQLNSRNGFPVFATILEANNVVKAHDQLAGFQLTEEDANSIRRLAKEPGIVNKIIDSIAPSIYGHRDIKTAVAASLFGGVPKNIHGKHNLRGDINVLLLGDPGTAKSQILKYVERVAHRAVFATGQGASAVGLTASVRKDPITNEWTLEGGALVLADRGTCLIDEFDKMNDRDRTSLHEAMEQQSISISKAGIVTTLRARCSIIAAANPIGGRYNSTIPFAQNVELTEPILSRFDVLCVVRDTVNPEADERLAKFVVSSHGSSHPLSGTDGTKRTPAAENPRLIPQDILRKYILFAKRECWPKIHQIDEEKLARLFSDMRRESLATGSFPITVRHLESIIRLSEAFAKMRLSDYVQSRDIDHAIGVIVESFIGAQKLSIKKSLGRAFAKYTLRKED